MAELFAQIILPLSLHDSYTYRVPNQCKKTSLPGNALLFSLAPNDCMQDLFYPFQIDIESAIEIKGNYPAFR